MYSKGETFSLNTNQVVNATVFFNFKQHLQKAFFDKTNKILVFLMRGREI